MKRFLCSLLVLAILVGYVPQQVIADGEQTAETESSDFTEGGKTELSTLDASEKVSDSDCYKPSEESNAVCPQDDSVQMDSTDIQKVEEEQVQIETAYSDLEAPPESVETTFLCIPKDLKLSVYLLDGSQKVLLNSEIENVYRLLPGTYCYTAEFSGYVPLDETEFSITESQEQMEIQVSLKPVPKNTEVENSEAEQSNSPDGMNPTIPDSTVAPETEETMPAAPDSTVTPETEKTEPVAPDSTVTPETEETKPAAPDSTVTPPETEETKPAAPDSTVAPETEKTTSETTEHNIPSLTVSTVSNSQKDFQINDSRKPEPQLPESSMTTEELQIGYLEKMFYQGDQVSMFGTGGRDDLTYPEQQFYDKLILIYRDIAAGRRSSTEFTISCVFTAQELGIDQVATVNSSGRVLPSDELSAAIGDIDIYAIRKSVSRDSPYDEYWLDRTIGYWAYPALVQNIYCDSNQAEISISYSFPVAKPFAKAGTRTEQGSFEADTSVTGRYGVAAKAGRNARNVVAQYSNLSDLGKLNAYKHYICTHVDYDYSAADSGITDENGGSPWQLINAFDEDPRTNIVCEGYSKAFQYLCDLSDFISDITCYQDSGGNHMWNIVEVDGVMVVADITNVDQDQGEVNSCYMVPVVYNDYGYVVADWIEYSRGRYMPAKESDCLSNISFTISAPEAGKKAITELDGNGFHVDVHWEPALVSGTFESNTHYTATACVRPTKAPFTESLTIAVNGTPRELHKSMAGFYQIVDVDFPATGLGYGWLKTGNRWKYRNKDGSFSINTWQYIDGDRYHFNAEGYRDTGLLQDGTDSYYLNQDGIMQSQYWHTTQGKDYYFGDDGRMIKNSWCYISPHDYHFDNEGVKQTGWLTLNGETFYLDSEGRSLVGWQDIGGKTYHFMRHSGMSRSTWIDHYYVGPDGVKDPNRVRDMFRDEQSGRRYYDHNGEFLKDTWQTLDGYRYHFNQAGFMDKSAWIEAASANPADRNYVDAQGHQIFGWQKIGGQTYYLWDNNGMAVGWQNINEPGDEWFDYYFDSEGRMLKNWQEIDGKTFYLGTDGRYLTEWQTIAGKTYYLDYTNGLLRNTWVDHYYVGPDGVKDPNRYRNGFHDDAGGRRYYDSKGEYARNCWKQIEADYYLGIKGGEYYFNENGYMQKDRWIIIGDEKSYVDSEGIRIDYGWHVIDGKTYHFEYGCIERNKWIDDEHYVNADGVLSEGGGHWILSDEDANGNSYWKYRYGDGSFAKNGWVTVENTKCFFDENGYAQEGWHFIDGYWYLMNGQSGFWTDYWYYERDDNNEYTGVEKYLDPDGHMAIGQIKYQGKGLDTIFTYYFDEQGVLQTGWYQWNGATYYADETGHAVIGWHYLDGQHYYFKDDCALARNQWINGLYVNADGVYVPDNTSILLDEKTFSDPHFRSYLQKYYDKDKNQMLSPEECDAVTVIRLDPAEDTFHAVSSLSGIENFKNLKVLDCSEHELSSLDLRSCTGLKELYCDGNQLTSLDLSMCPNIEKLSCSYNHLTSLSIDNLEMLQSFKCESNYLDIDTPHGKLDLNTLAGFDISKVSQLAGGVMDGKGILTIQASHGLVTYTYDCGAGKVAKFLLQGSPEVIMPPVPIYRLYNPNTGEHLMSSHQEEIDMLAGIGWSVDGLAWYSAANGEPVYRLYNPYDGSHLYTMIQQEIDNCVSLGWTIDGIVCCNASEDTGIPIYRLFNPYVQAHYHLYTTNQEEINTLTALGWRLEGIAWYAEK